MREMFGQYVEYAFYRCAGWPLVSAGLGGYLPPDEMLAEAELMPCDVERENYHRMLSEIVPFMNEEIRRFFQQQDKKNLNQEAYNTILSLIGDRSDEFLDKIEDTSNAFVNNFKANT